MKVIWQSEINPHACAVLKKHWPNTPNIGDITKVNWHTIPKPNILCGGYPCQPFSLAGTRKGNNDSRHLWPEFYKAICILRPDYTIMENVRGHLTLGFKQVLKDLADIGYDAEWQIIPASALNAPHKRERLIIVAYPKSDNGNERKHFNNTKTTQKRKTLQKQIRRSGRSFINPKINQWENEPNVGRVANGVPFGLDRLRELGNAIVPQVAEHVGRLIILHSQ